MSAFSEKGLLGELEQLVLLAALRLGEQPYAVSIRDEIHERTGIALSRSTVYVTLDRLHRKGYVRSWFADPTPERGGKAKRCFLVTNTGVQALLAAERALARLRLSPHAPSRQ
jgi:PadR family transcriptional regulator PadR